MLATSPQRGFTACSRSSVPQRRPTGNGTRDLPSARRGPAPVRCEAGPMPWQSVDVGGTRIRFELLYKPGTDRRTPVVLTPGGRGGGEVLRWLADILSADRPVLLWDRPNTGASDICLSVSYHGQSEADMHAEKLRGLLSALQIRRVALFGTSNGGRMAAFFAARFPEMLSGIVLNNTTAGPKAAVELSREYYMQYLPILDAGGPPALARTPHFGAMCEGNPDNARILAAQDPVVARANMADWGAFVATRGDPSLYPIAGGTDASALAALGARGTPALCLYTHPRQWADGMHTEEALRGVHSAILHGHSATWGGPGGSAASAPPPPPPPGLFVSENMTEFVPVVREFLRRTDEADTPAGGWGSSGGGGGDVVMM